MKFIWEGLKQAVRLILQGDPDILEVVVLTLKVSGFATLISVMIGIPLGLCVAMANFRTKGNHLWSMQEWPSLLLWQAFGSAYFYGETARLAPGTYVYSTAMVIAQA